MTPAAALERVRDICLALPRAIEKTSHGAPGFLIEKGRFFAYFWHDRHSDGRMAVIVKTSGVEEQDMLIEGDPDLYFRPPYLGPSGWVGLLVEECDWDHVADRIGRSWTLAAPARLAQAFGG